MKPRSRYARIVAASLFFGALLFLSGCGIADHRVGVVPSHVSFGRRCPGCGLTKSTGCRCTPDGWSYGQTVWRPLEPPCDQWIEMTEEIIDPMGGHMHDNRPRLAPTEDVPSGHETTHETTSLRTKHASLLSKWGEFWLPPKPIMPLSNPSDVVFPAPERLSRIAMSGL